MLIGIRHGVIPARRPLLNFRGRMPSKRTGRKDVGTGGSDLAVEHFRPTLDQQFGSILVDNYAAERRSTLAVLKIVELIVSGRIPQLPGEDYFVTACRLIAHGVSDVKTSAATRQALNKALAQLKRSDRRAIPDLVEMRRWRGKRVITRTLLLLTMLEKVVGPVELTGWLQRSNPNLGKWTPIDLTMAGRWSVLADFVDDMLTGSPT